ncbi:MAG: hypothetical protein EOL87_16100 [Spartobacteria bacterium]|nr:hypothetical protein [Spartobacteria bacterium]
MTKNDDVQLGKFARRVMKLESTEALCKYFERFLATLGFTGFMYTAIDHHRQSSGCRIGVLPALCTLRSLDFPKRTQC